TVAARNRQTAREADAFARAGWTMVAAPPPDARLLSLDPALVDGRERELRVQIASTVPAPELAPRLARIARAAHEPQINLNVSSISFAVPYQDVEVPASQWLTTYWWRFSSNNGYVQSGWTGWSSFYRSL
ncbi:MAG: hypothetical protein JWM53_4753, partial [bacterium]|nr:hypothetical protein [bacterium]